MNLKKLWPATAVTLLAFTCVAHADCKLNNGSCSQSGSNASFKGGEQLIVPHFISNKAHNDEGAFSVSADLLWWKAHQDGMVYATTDEDGNSSNANFKGKEKLVDGDWDLGFRLGASYLAGGFDKFDFNVGFTYYKMKDSTKTDYKADSVALLPVWTHPAIIDDVYSAAPLSNNEITKSAATWEVDAWWIDANWGRTFKPFGTTWLSVHPHAGIRFMDIAQTFSIKNSLAGGEPTVADFSQNTKLVNDFFGFGLRGGVDTEWGFADNWNLYASFAATVFCGEFDLKYTDKTTADTDLNYEVNISSKPKSGKAMTDFDMGLMWENVWNDSWGLTVKLGWEHHAIFNMNQMTRFVDGTAKGSAVHNHGDLFFNGLKLNARFDF